MALGRSGRHRAVDRMCTEKIGKIPRPGTEFGSGNSRRIVVGVFEDAEDLVGEEVSDGSSHAHEALHEKVDGILAVGIERRTCALGGVSPGIIMVQPGKEKSTKGVPTEMKKKKRRTY